MEGIKPMNTQKKEWEFRENSVSIALFPNIRNQSLKRKSFRLESATNMEISIKTLTKAPKPVPGEKNEDRDRSKLLAFYGNFETTKNPTHVT